MKQWKVTVTLEFGNDIRAIHSYISNTLLEPIIAKKMIDRILKAVGELSLLPLRYPLYDKEPWKSRGLRKMTVGNYLVFYIVQEEIGNVVVLRFLYSGRDIEKCLEE